MQDKCRFCQNNCPSKRFSQQLLDKYGDSYLRELAILYHIRELELKANKCIASDNKPFHNGEFLKELADLYILLDFMKFHDSTFSSLIKSRIQKFESKVKSSKPSKFEMNLLNVEFENKKEFDNMCNNLPHDELQCLKEFLNRFDKLLLEYNTHAQIYVHEDQMRIYIIFDSNNVKNLDVLIDKAYGLVDNMIADIINIGESVES